MRKLNSQFTINTCLSNDFEELKNGLGLPFLVKPRQGFGSRGIEIICDHDSFLKYKNDIGESLMAQQIVGNINEEYTTSAFCDGKGGYIVI